MPSSALQVARTGLEAQDARMRVIANNLANVNTTGFKRDRANFATLAYQDARVAGQQSSTESSYAVGLNLGTGVQVQSTSRIVTQGTLNSTGNSLDLALGGLLLGTVETFVNGSQWSTYKDAIAFAILIIILLFRPAGLLGKFTVEKV